MPVDTLVEMAITHHDDPLKPHPVQILGAGTRHTKKPTTQCTNRTCLTETSTGTFTYTHPHGKTKSQQLVAVATRAYLSLVTGQACAYNVVHLLGIHPRLHTGYQQTPRITHEAHVCAHPNTTDIVV